MLVILKCVRESSSRAPDYCEIDQMGLGAGGDIGARGDTLLR
eukprot:COSAG01_NODE_1381_length_10520_cov_2.661710_9_plen_42_part_00